MNKKMHAAKIKIIPIFFLCFLCSYFASGQDKYTIRGNLADTTSRMAFVNSSIVVLRAKDSVLCKFTRSTINSSFSLNNLAAGDYILLVTFTGYADYTSRFSLTEAHPIHDFGSIPLSLKSKLLTEIVVQGKITTMTIKGDTTEYNAAAYKTDPNAKVEELLKQFPGISVDQNGKITAQGKTVTKVLVDGEEFFGDDPTLVTQNVRADMVDKVQLYDRTSDRATFTGIDDGKKEKTLNIKLRQDKKTGYFGKVTAGAGTDGNYRGQGMFNSFAGKRRISLFGNLDNTGKLGLSWWDNTQIGMSDNATFLDGVTIINASGDDLETISGQYNGQGIPLAKLGGIHYDNKFNDDKQAVNVSYKIGALTVDGASSSLTQNNLPDAYINSSSNDMFHKYTFRQRLQGMAATDLDSTSYLKLTMDGTLKNGINTDSYKTDSRRADSSLLNNNQRLTDNHLDEQDFNAKLLYAKKFKKPRRTLSISVTDVYTHNKANGLLKSNSNYYDEHGQVTSSDAIDQHKNYASENNIFNAGVTYTEPVSRTGSISLQYGLTSGSGTSNRQTFNPSPEGKYDLPDSSLSNNFSLDQLSHQAGVEFTFKVKKSLFRFGTNMSFISFDQVDKYNNGTLDRNFTTFNPKAIYSYSFGTGYLAVSYNGSSTLPLLTELQPVAVNTDPLNIALGNPGLKPSNQHLFDVTFTAFRPLTKQSIWYVVNYGITTSPIVSNRTTDAATGKSVYQSANINRSISFFSLSGGIDKTFDTWKLKTGENTMISGSTIYNMVNGVLNKTSSYDLSEQLSASKTATGKYSFNASVGPTYSIRQSSLQLLHNNSFGVMANGGFTVYLPAHFQLSSDANYTYNGKTQNFSDFSRLLLNASVSRAFLKDESVKLSALANDLLNQNTGFSRTASGNLIMQNSYTTIRRYFMLAISWDFNKMNSGKSKN